MSGCRAPKALASAAVLTQLRAWRSHWDLAPARYGLASQEDLDEIIAQCARSPDCGLP